MFDASAISPIAFSVCGVSIYWYGISYTIGLFVALVYAQRLQRLFFHSENKCGGHGWRGGAFGYVGVGGHVCTCESKISSGDIRSFFQLACCAVVIGGRIGHVIFFEPEFYLRNPMQIFDFRNGGMAFHGALVSMVISLWIFCRVRHKRSNTTTVMLEYADLIATVAPIGLCLGRLANFVNNELYGTPTTSWVGVIFRGVDSPRHPTQLYEACSEGVLTFVLLRFLLRYESVRRCHGILFAVFLISYAVSRIVVDFFKDAPTHAGLTTGQWLSLAMLLCGCALLWWRGRAGTQWVLVKRGRE
jgi:phosphatidylglycerol:prolipoprotein diacylglycerol transferase